VTLEQRPEGDKLNLVIHVKERPILRKWTVRGPNGSPRERSRSESSWWLGAQSTGPPKSGARRDRFALSGPGILLGHDQAQRDHRGRREAARHLRHFRRQSRSHQPGGRFGNEKFSDEDLVHHTSTKPEGFFWWQKDPTTTRR
jgi:hypothetical protein